MRYNSVPRVLQCHASLWWHLESGEITFHQAKRCFLVTQETYTSVSDQLEMAQEICEVDLRNCNLGGGFAEPGHYFTFQHFIGGMSKFPKWRKEADAIHHLRQSKPLLIRSPGVQMPVDCEISEVWHPELNSKSRGQEAAFRGTDCDAFTSHDCLWFFACDMVELRPSCLEALKLHGT